MMHLTNYSLNKNSEGYVHNDGSAGSDFPGTPSNPQTGAVHAPYISSSSQSGDSSGQGGGAMRRSLSMPDEEGALLETKPVAHSISPSFQQQLESLVRPVVHQPTRRLTTHSC